MIPFGSLDKLTDEKAREWLDWYYRRQVEQAEIMARWMPWVTALSILTVAVFAVLWWMETQ